MGMNERIACWIRTARERSGFSRGIVAGFLGCSEEALANYERGTVPVGVIEFVWLCELYDADGPALVRDLMSSR